MIVSKFVCVDTVFYATCVFLKMPRELGDCFPEKSVCRVISITTQLWSDSPGKKGTKNILSAGPGSNPGYCSPWLKFLLPEFIRIPIITEMINPCARKKLALNRAHCQPLIPNRLQ